MAAPLDTRRYLAPSEQRLGWHLPGVTSKRPEPGGPFPRGLWPAPTLVFPRGYERPCPAKATWLSVAEHPPSSLHARRGARENQPASRGGCLPAPGLRRLRRRTWEKPPCLAGSPYKQCRGEGETSGDSCCRYVLNVPRSEGKRLP